MIEKLKVENLKNQTVAVPTAPQVVHDLVTLKNASNTIEAKVDKLKVDDNNLMKEINQLTSDIAANKNKISKRATKKELDAEVDRLDARISTVYDSLLSLEKRVERYKPLYLRVWDWFKGLM